MNTPTPIQQLYAQLCTKAGDLQYRIKVQQAELEDVNARLKALNELNAAAAPAPNEQK